MDKSLTSSYQPSAQFLRQGSKKHIESKISSIVEPYASKARQATTRNVGGMTPLDSNESKRIGGALS